jgi:cell division protein ZapA
MAQVSVSIGGRAYRLACNPGEEEHLGTLARRVDEQIKEMRASFGEIGDQRLTVMAALTIADEVTEAQARADASARLADEVLQSERAARLAAEARAEGLTHTINEMSVRIENLAATIAGAGKE